MELISLDGDFRPGYLVENYESLIWSERYSGYGDFELKTTEVQRTMELLPRESYVTLRESTVPMKVEDYKIQKTPRSAPVLQVTGRSFEAPALENRASVQVMHPTEPRPGWTIKAARSSDAAYLAMRVVLGDVARFNSNGVEILPQISPAVSPLDAIPEVDLTLPADFIPIPTSVPAWVQGTSYPKGSVVSYNSADWWAPRDNTGAAAPASPGNGDWLPVNEHEVKAGNLYTTALDLIHPANRGLKSVRPASGKNQVSIEIYNGANLTETVVFDARFDQLEDATYLLSQRGSMDVAYAYGATGAQIVLKTTSEEPSGLNRRVLLVDQIGEEAVHLGSPSEIRRSRALVELYKYNATALFDGQVAWMVAEGYNTDYHLGDIIKLTGEYGLSQNVRVSEFIRSSDASGEKAYPTFEAVD